MTDEPKSCAHCGNDAKWIQEIQQSPDSVRLGYVRCSECEIRTGSMLTKSEAISAWNQREPIGNPDELPGWVKEKITIRRRELDRHIGNEFVKNTFECGMDAALKWVLSLRREDAE